MQFPNKIKFHIRTKFKLSSFRCMQCFDARRDEQVFRAKFVLPIVYTTVAVVLREGVYRKIARSTILCKSLNRSSTGSQWSILNLGFSWNLVRPNFSCTKVKIEYSEFRLRSKIPCCVRNLEGLRTQPGRLCTCGRSPHVYMNAQLRGYQ